MTNWVNFTVADLFEIINGKGITTEEIENNPGNFERSRAARETME